MTHEGISRVVKGIQAHCPKEHKDVHDLDEQEENKGDRSFGNEAPVQVIQEAFPRIDPPIQAGTARKREYVQDRASAFSISMSCPRAAQLPDQGRYAVSKCKSRERT